MLAPLDPPPSPAPGIATRSRGNVPKCGEVSYIHSDAPLVASFLAAEANARSGSRRENTQGCSRARSSNSVDDVGIPGVRVIQILNRAVAWCAPQIIHSGAGVAHKIENQFCWPPGPTGQPVNFKHCLRAPGLHKASMKAMQKPSQNYR